ncbi:ADP ribosylglycohydrolase [Rhodococcus phage Trina]|uniref:ADP ribosylglycohydrolase n=1 Tax=Rhodococcus phage Trina TaxID=2027905 RepID=A0A2D0ZND4_9CAUD|nr:ADP ribosylglycohydrolase [Rhodococcus phage Trina]ASZ74858.1 ADP ribosylglycohydrolase [Rhodococcus phage Trina]
MSWIGVLKGVAYGDSWGDPHEFMSYEEIFTNGFPYGPAPELFVTDDTQMTLYLAEALEKAEDLPFNKMVHNIEEAFIKWYHDPDNNRSPGQTCMKSVEHLIENGHYSENLTWNNSKGNGSLMRFWPSAYIKSGVSSTFVANAQSVLTHQHMTVVRCMELATMILIKAENGSLKPEDALNFALDYELKQGTACDDLRKALQNAIGVRPKFVHDPFFADPCKYIGDGWVVEEALAIALLALSLPRKPISQLQWSVITGGDSDTIGAITGGFIGAFHGDIWPEEWLTRLEPRYREWITKDWNLNDKPFY